MDANRPVTLADIQELKTDLKSHMDNRFTQQDLRFDALLEILEVQKAKVDSVTKKKPNSQPEVYLFDS